LGKPTETLSVSKLGGRGGRKKNCSRPRPHPSGPSLEKETGIDDRNDLAFLPKKEQERGNMEIALPNDGTRERWRVQTASRPTESCGGERGMLCQGEGGKSRQRRKGISRRGKKDVRRPFTREPGMGMTSQEKKRESLIRKHRNGTSQEKEE